MPGSRWPGKCVLVIFFMVDPNTHWVHNGPVKLRVGSRRVLSLDAVVMPGTALRAAVARTVDAALSVFSAMWNIHPCVESNEEKGGDILQKYVGSSREVDSSRFVAVLDPLAMPTCRTNTRTRSGNREQSPNKKSGILPRTKGSLTFSLSFSIPFRQGGVESRLASPCGLGPHSPDTAGGTGCGVARFGVI